MPANYRFSQSIESNPIITKSAASPTSLVHFQATNGTRYIAVAERVINRVNIFALGGTDGNLDSAIITNASNSITRTLAAGGQPYGLVQFQINNGTRYIAVAESGLNRVSIFPISGTNGNVDSAIVGDTTNLITRSVGNVPYGLIHFQAGNTPGSGTRYIATVDASSNRVSIFPIGGTDGNLDSAIITNATLITKGVGSLPQNLIQFQATNGTRYIATADFNSGRVSIFALGGTDGEVSSTIISAFTLITKGLGASSGPTPLVHFQATNGTRYIATGDRSANRVSIFALGGTDGNIDSSTISNPSNQITKTVGVTPFGITHFQGNNGVNYLATADTGSSSNRVSIFGLGGSNGNVDSTIIGNFPLITKILGTSPYNIIQFAATNGTRYIATTDSGSSRVSILAISGTAESYLPINNIVNFTIQSSSNFITGANLAQVGLLVDYFNFAAGVTFENTLFTPFFDYTFTADDTGTLGNGATLQFTTSTADITNASGITVASGATVRLGLKATYAIELFFQAGSTLEVFPNSIRGGANLDLSKCTFAATVNLVFPAGTAAGSTATVFVPAGASANISAASGITVQDPPPTITFTGLPAGGIFTIWDDEIADPQDLGTALQTTNPTTGNAITYVGVAGNAVVYQFIPDSGNSANFQEFNISATIPNTSQTIDFTANLEQEVNL